jgi:hypothetical protein
MASTLPGGPRMGDPINFVLYYSEPVADDPNIIGQSRAGWISYVHPDDGSVNLMYMVGGQPNEPDNPPLGGAMERKIRVHYDPTGKTPRTWHYPSDVE